MKKWLNIFYFLLLIIGVVSCNGQENKKSTSNNKEYSSNINRALPAPFDKKYFHGYQLSPDSDYPIYSHTDKNFGNLTISFINKDIDKQKEWLQFDFNNNLELGDDPDDKYFDNLNKIIKTKLEPNLNTYKIIAEHVPAKYLESKTLDYIYPYTKTYYLYNKEKKSWDFIKEKIISDGANEKNITKLTELNAMINLSYSKNAVEKSKTDTINSSISLEKTEGVWSTDCKLVNYLSISSTINNIQFSIPNRFSMNAELKKIGTNKYEFYFTDFPPIIPLPDEMQNWENMDNKKPVGYLEIINDSKISLTWLGFYYKKTKKYIQTENPFDKNNSKATIIRCHE